MNFASPDFRAFVASLKTNGWGRYSFLSDERDAIQAELVRLKIEATPTGGNILWSNDALWSGTFTQWMNFDIEQEKDANVSPSQYGIVAKP